MQTALFVIGFLLFIGLILVHEWGHYIVARRNGVKVEEFGLGFPPRAWGRKLRSGMMLSLNYLPLGGFVKLKGEHDSATAKGSFGAASFLAKTKILVAGVTMNALVGILMLTLLALVGMPKLLTADNVGEEQFTVASDTQITHQFLQVGYILPDSPAEKAGLEPRDIIKSISRGSDTRTVTTPQQLRAATEAFEGQTVDLRTKRGSAEQVRRLTLLDRATVEASENTDDPQGYLGVSPNELVIQRSTWSAPIVALGFTAQLIELTLEGLGKAVAGLGSIVAGVLTGNDAAKDKGHEQATSQVGGPVAIVAILWGGGDLGLNFILFIIAILSLTLALINILPIPALDGGRLFVMALSRVIKGKPFSRNVEELIHSTGMAVLLTLIVLITIVDVGRFL